LWPASEARSRSSAKLPEPPRCSAILDIEYGFGELSQIGEVMVSRRTAMARFRDRLFRQLGYVPASEVLALLDRLCDRVEQLDEPMAREFVLDPQPGGIEHKISLMCKRRKVTITRLAAEEFARLIGERPA
jgi:hypothetical protein